MPRGGRRLPALRLIDGLRRRTEFLVGVPILIGQHVGQRAVDALRDSRAYIERERRNARVIGEFTVRSVASRRTSSMRPVEGRTIPEPTASNPPASVQVGQYAHLGVADLLAAIPTLSIDERRALLADELAGPRRTRVIDLLEDLERRGA